MVLFQVKESNGIIKGSNGIRERNQFGAYTAKFKYAAAPIMFSRGSTEM